MRAAADRSTDSFLAASLRLAREEAVSAPTAPDLAEVAASHPELALAAFEGERLVRSAGSLHLEATTPAGHVKLQNGEPAVVAWDERDGLRIAAALPWRSQQEALDRLALTLLLLWPLLAGLFALVTWLASKATFRPLEQLAAQAEALSGGTLGQRLAIPEGREFGEFTARLNRFLDRQEESIRKQERFVEDAAHELRTPLAVVCGSIETTLRHSRSSDELEATLRTVLSEAERLSQLVEVLLQSAAPERGVVPTLDLGTAVERSHARWVDRFAEAQVGLELEASPALCEIREEEIAVVIDNLLANALRASPSGTTCTLSSASEDGKGVVVVEDQGPGVAEDQADRIFERFSRIDEGRARNQGGFGIGLSVCQRMLALRGGTISLEPQNGGARFVVRLPLAAR